MRMPFDDGLDRKAPEIAVGTGFPAWCVRWQGRRYQRMVGQYGLKRPDYCEMSFSLLVSQEEPRTVEYLLSLLLGLFTLIKIVW